MPGEYEFEPVRGLPERLPPGERMLWQGSPRWRSLALRAFRVRAVAIYFGLLMLWRVAAALSDGESFAQAALSAAKLIPLAAAAIAILALLAWLSARATVYTITDRRLVIRSGVALPLSVNLPFAAVESAGLKRFRDGTGDIALALVRGQRVGYVSLWPHVRPWHFSRPQPALRALAHADEVARTLSAALAASVGGPPAGATAGTPALQPAPGHALPSAA
jgi:hypothetical protein